MRGSTNQEIKGIIIEYQDGREGKEMGWEGRDKERLPEEEEGRGRRERKT